VPAQTEYCIHISLHLGEWDTVNMGKATQLTQASGSLMRGSSLIGVQASSCGSNKYIMFIYLDKKNNNASIQTGSDEDKRKECEFRKILCQCVECQGQHNITQTTPVEAKVN